MTGRLVVSALATIAACGAPERLEPPPEPIVCSGEGESCDVEGFEAPELCCGDLWCFRGTCIPPDDLTWADAAVDSCTPEQVDIAILVDLSDSMDSWIEDAAQSLIGTLEAIPPTTTVQVWVTPPFPGVGELDGTYAQVTEPGRPETARTALEAMTDGAGGMEATLDWTSHMLRSVEHWRFGTTVRALIVISDEQPHTYYTPPTTMGDVCDLRLPSDRLFAFTRSLISSTWSTCYDTRPISGLWQLPELLADPCATTDH